MSPNLLRFPARAERSACVSTLLLTMLVLFAPRLTLAQTSAVANAASVTPAAIVDKPLTPVTNDIPGEQPSLQHVWVPGHWRWNEGSYVWEAGRWEIPPMANVQWVPPQWEQQGTGYVLKEGYWQEIDPNQQNTAGIAPAPQVIEATAPPPPAQREIIVERPSPEYAWVPGYWAWRHGRHVWVAGRWERPPRPGQVWVPARWEYRNGRYVMIEGYWRDTAVMTMPPPQQVVIAPAATPTQQVVVVTAPPPPRSEVVYARPAPGYVWVPGYWAWRGGRHVWVAGHWELPPHEYRTWIEPRWERRGGNWFFVEGHWGR